MSILKGIFKTSTEFCFFVLMTALVVWALLITKLKLKMSWCRTQMSSRINSIQSRPFSLISSSKYFNPYKRTMNFFFFLHSSWALCQNLQHLQYSYIETENFASSNYKNGFTIVSQVMYCVIFFLWKQILSCWQEQSALM